MLLVWYNLSYQLPLTCIRPSIFSTLWSGCRWTRILSRICAASSMRRPTSPLETNSVSGLFWLVLPCLVRLFVCCSYFGAYWALYMFFVTLKCAIPSPLFNFPHSFLYAPHSLSSLITHCHRQVRSGGSRTHTAYSRLVRWTEGASGVCRAQLHGPPPAVPRRAHQQSG